MERVSFKVAKALKEVGYPQELHEGTIYYVANGLMDKYDSELYELFDPMYCVCPYVLEVWLWLWREKKECINIMTDIHGDCRSVCDNGAVMPKHSDPEEAIIAAIEYLVDNDLIK